MVLRVKQMFALPFVMNGNIPHGTFSHFLQGTSATFLEAILNFCSRNGEVGLFAMPPFLISRENQIPI